MAELIHLVDGVVTNEFALDEAGASIGRAPDNSIQIDDIAVSAAHARILPDDDGGFVIEDLDSTNGTYINEQRIRRQRLQPGDQLRIGWTVFKYAEPGAPELEKTARVKKTWIPGVYVTRKD